jgi:hypothetical protein
MKHLYKEDLELSTGNLAQVSSLEIRCRAETWRDSYLGEQCDRERFVKGRQQVIEYAGILSGLMEDRPEVVEDRTWLGKGCVAVRMRQGRTLLRSNVSLGEAAAID